MKTLKKASLLITFMTVTHMTSMHASEQGTQICNNDLEQSIVTNDLSKKVMESERFTTAALTAVKATSLLRANKNSFSSASDLQKLALHNSFLRNSPNRSTASNSPMPDTSYTPISLDDL